MTQSRDAARPSWRRLFAEMPAMARLIGAQFGKPPVTGRQGGGRPVIVIPGLMAGDIATGLLRRTLKACGFRGYGWKQGMNLGADPAKFAGVLARIDRIHTETGQPVALIGWSLGGLYARELAKRRPDAVSQVLTLGTPFSVHQRDNNAWKLYEAINDHPVDRTPIPMQPQVKPPAPTIAMWSQRDGIVAPASASGAGHEVDESIELNCRHHEFVSSPEALKAIVGVLSRHAVAPPSPASEAAVRAEAVTVLLPAPQLAIPASAPPLVPIAQ